MPRRVRSRSFGQMVLEAGLTTGAQLDECRAFVKEAERKGKARSIEDVVREKGYMTDERIGLMVGALCLLSLAELKHRRRA